jgi:hypothetical protein
MKTLTFLFLGLFTSIIIPSLSAQNDKNLTGSYVETSIWDGYYIPVPVYCEGDEFDLLVGQVTLHTVFNYQKGIFAWAKTEYSGEVVSNKTGEVFRIKDNYQSDNFVWTGGKGHCNIIGNSGTHYILHYLYDYQNYSFTFVKAVCPGNE